MKLSAVIILFILISYTLTAQSILTFQGHSWKLKYKIGYLGIHHSSMSHLPRQYAQAVELSYYKNSTGVKEIDQAFGNPKIGATLFHGTVGNNEILGHYSGLYGFVEFPFVKQNNFEWNSKLGVGLAFTNKCFKNENRNIPIGSFTNAQICIGTEFIINRGKNYWHTGIDITHFSNAATKLPNYGINLFYLSLGYSRNLSNNEKSLIKQDSRLPIRKWLFGGILIGSWKEVMPINSSKNLVGAINLHSKRFFNYKSGIEFDLDIIYKESTRYYLPQIEKNFTDIIQIGLYGAYIIPLEKFHFIFGMGAYLRDKFKPEDPLYHRIGMRYQWQNGIISNLTLKTHFGRADYLEWGIGYVFNYEQN